MQLLYSFCELMTSSHYRTLDSETRTNTSTRFSQILSIAHAWSSVILAGKRDNRRHSTTSFIENVSRGNGGTSYQM